LSAAPAVIARQTSAQPLPAFVPAARRAVDAMRRRPASVTNVCSGKGSGAFVGGGGVGLVAFGPDSGVVSGQSNEACDQLGVIGGGETNTIYPPSGKIGNAESSFIGAGDSNLIESYYAFLGSGDNNELFGPESFIGAGQFNLVGASSFDFIGAGRTNMVTGNDAVVVGGKTNVSSGESAFDGAGESNTPQGDLSSIVSGQGNNTSGTGAFVGSGFYHTVSAGGSFIGAGDFLTYASDETNGSEISGIDAFIGAGDQNSISATAAFIGAGQRNAIGSSASYSAIVAGNQNSTGGAYAAVLGGFGNSATGQYAVITGGNSNSAAGSLSFAAGYHAGATHNGSFVWSDYVTGSATVKDPAANQFVVRASGGTIVYSNEGATSGVSLSAGSGTWSSLSDRNAKTDIVPIDDDAVLEKVATLPISTWRYKSERGVRHTGPMAQDFYAAFGIGEDDRHITSIDEDGVALSAIKALHRENEQLRTRLAVLESKFDALAASRGH
jgi:hypothetical protein